MGDFEKNVFINCPFDEEYEPLLQAILFCVLYLSFRPRLALERADSSQNRLAKISGLISESRYSIHDLSRLQAKEVGEFYRLNMPFELGIDYGCKRYADGHFKTKRLLVLEEKKYRYQAALSDLAGCDIQIHNNDFEKVIRVVRNWLVAEAGAARSVSPTEILNGYVNFQEWHYEKRLDEGFSEKDIQEYPTPELLESMQEWHLEGRPASF